MNQDRMKKIYYNCEITNQTTEPVEAKYQVGLLKAIVDNPENYNLCINRFRIPLNAVPLSRQNIPFQKWQIGLGYKDVDSPNWSNVFEYVPQINQKTAMTHSSYNVNSQQIQLVDNNLSLGSVLSSKNIQNASSLKPAYDLQFGGVIYVVNTNLTQVDVYDMQSFNLITSLSAPSSRVITCITADPTTGKFFMAYWDGTASNTYIQQYEHAGYSTFTSSNQYYTNTLRNGYIKSMCFLTNQLFAIFQPVDGGTSPIGYLSVYDEGVGAPVANNSWTWENSFITCNPANNIIFVSVPSENSIDAYFPTNISPAYITNVGRFSGFSLSQTSNPFVGYDIDNNIILDTGSTIQVRGYTLPSSMPYLYDVPFTDESKLIFCTAPALAPVESDPYSIFSYQEYLNQINQAFQTAYMSLINRFPAITVAEAPRIIFNPETKLFSFVCVGDFLQSSMFRIYLNESLWSMFLFPYSINSDMPLYKTVVVQNNIYNVVFSNGSTPSYVSVLQESPTSFKFYDLVRLLVVTSRIPVSGDVEGINTSVNLITDIVPDVSELTPDDIIVYNPTVLRYYNLQSNIPLQNIDLQFYYGSKDGSVHKIFLNPNEYASCKIEFQQVL